MRNKPWIIAAVIGVIMALAAFLVWTPSEPVYQGKPLSYWLQAYKIRSAATPSRLAGNAVPAGDNAPARYEADAAIRTIGTNALPTLLRMIEYRNSPLENRMLSLAGKIPFVRIQPRSPLDPNYEALMAFQVLGANAGPAVPRLMEIYNHESDRETKDWVLPVLAAIGPPAKPAIPMLLRALSGTNTWLRENAVRALDRIRADAAEVVPPLISCLDSTNARLRLTAVMALGDFGQEAKAAVPALLELIQDEKRSAGPTGGFNPPGVRTPTVGEMARKSLWYIDREAAAKAGISYP